MIYLIYAVDKNNLIGSNNRLPWDYKEDIKFFRETTYGKDVLVGDKTYVSLLSYYKHLLPFRTIYLATQSKTNVANTTVVNDARSFLRNYKNDLYVIGGKTIYEISYDFADVIYETRIDKEYVGDTYLKKPDYSKFNLVSERVSGDLHFLKYVRKK